VKSNSKSLTEAQEHVPEPAQATQELDPNCMVSGEQSRLHQQQTEPSTIYNIHSTEPMTPVEEQEGDRGGSTEDEDQDDVKDPGELPAETQLEHISGNQELIKEVPQEHQYTYSSGNEVDTQKKMTEIQEEQEPADSNPIPDNQVHK